MTPNDKELIKNAVRLAEQQPEWFYKNILNFQAMGWQIKATEAVFDVRRAARGQPTVINHAGKQRITIRAGHGPGKTHWLAALTHLWNFTTYGLIAVTAPKQDTLRTRYFHRYKRILAASADWYRQMIKADILKASINGDETWGVQGETASEPENLAGYHDSPQLFLVDEASGRRMDPMFPTIEGALSTPGSVLVEIGNPTRDEGEFYQHHNRPDLSSLYYRMHVRPEDAKEIVSEQWVDTMRVKYGEDSPIFKVRVLGDFAPMDRNQLISMTWVEECREAGEDSALLEGDGSLPKLRISVDVADGGKDFSVITAALHYETVIIMLKQKKYNFPMAVSAIRTADAAEEMFHEYDGDIEVDDIVVDSIGVGSGTAGTLLDRGYRVVIFKGGEAAPGFRNVRSRGYLALRDALRDGNIIFKPEFTYDWDNYMSQLCSHRLVPGNEKQDDVETKEAYIKRVKKSPDESDSTMMQMAHKIPVIGIPQLTAPVVVTSSRFGY